MIDALQHGLFGFYYILYSGYFIDTSTIFGLVRKDFTSIYIFSAKAVLCTKFSRGTFQSDTSVDYLGNIKMEIILQYENPPLSVINRACSIILGKVANVVFGIEETYEGAKKFTPKHLFVDDMTKI